MEIGVNPIERDQSWNKLIIFKLRKRHCSFACKSDFIRLEKQKSYATKNPNM